LVLSLTISEIETWLLLTAYRKSPAPYSTVQSYTVYDLSFSHNTARLACPYKVIQSQ